MDENLNANLQLLNQVMDELDPSPGDWLIFLNHMLGWLSSSVDVETWGEGIESARSMIVSTRSARP